MITCPIHPTYTGYRPPVSKNPACRCWDVYNDRTQNAEEYHRHDFKKSLSTASRKPLEERVDASVAQVCHCGRPATHIIRKYQQKDRPVCRLHKG
jgi:hypothetical protein